jgi:hypothetical protein
MIERLTRLAEASNVLEVDQGDYREGRGGNLNMHKIDYLSSQALEQNWGNPDMADHLALKTCVQMNIHISMQISNLT